MGLLGDYMPQWLPEDPDKQAAMRQGLLQFGAAMLQGRGNFGNAFGGGLAAGAQGYGAALEDQKRQQLQSGQLKILQNKDAREQQLQRFMSSRFGVGAGGGPVGQADLPPNAAEALAAGGAAGSIGPTIENAQRMDAMPPPTQQRKSFPMSFDDVVGLKAMGGADLMDAYKIANEGFERKQGSTYVMPDGSERAYANLDKGQIQGRDGSISHATGYIPAMTEAELARVNAQEQAKAQYDLLPLGYVGTDGRPIGGTRANYISSLGSLPKVGGPVTLPPVRQPSKAAAPSQQGFPTISKAEQNGRDGGRLQILQAELATATNPADIAALQREIAGTRRQMGAPVLQSAAEAKAQVGAVETSLEAGKGLNSNWLKEVHNPVQAEGKAARSTLTQLETVKNVNFNSGWGAETKAYAANLLASLGVKGATEYATSSQQFQQVAMEKLLTTMQAQVGVQTEGDSQRAQKTFVSLSNTPQANQFIVDLAGANARIAARKADYYNQALPHAKAGGDMTEIDRRWSKIAPSVWSDPGLSKYKKVK